MSGTWTVRGAQIALGSLTGISTLPTAPANWWLALGAASADPALDPTIFTELESVANYVRQKIIWQYSGDVFASNKFQLSFANLGSGNIQGIRIYDDNPAGNILWWSNLSSLISFSAGHTVNFPQGIIRVGLTL